MYWVNEKDAKTALGGRSVGWVWNSGGKHWPNPRSFKNSGWKSDFLGILNGKSYRALSTNWERRLSHDFQDTGFAIRTQDPFSSLE